MAADRLARRAQCLKASFEGALIPGSEWDRIRDDTWVMNVMAIQVRPEALPEHEGSGRASGAFPGRG
ncbi:MAG: hypothetical protein OXN97_21380 [Bryobacterales bacterium]|nr:hypothetical protein [Bryobacterales bacterium]